MVDSIRKIRQRFRLTRIGSESGQGVLEYMLLLVIIIVLILGLAYQFNTAFRSWAEGFFDGYVACLLETGELPGVSQQCMEEYVDFDFSKGQNLADGRLGSGGDGGGQDGGRGARNNDGGGGGETLVTGGDTGRVGFARLGAERGRQETTRVGTTDGGSDGGSKVSMGSDTTQIGRVTQNTGRRETVSMTYYIDADEEKVEKTRPTAAKAGKVDEGGDALRTSGTSVDSEVARSSASIKDPETFSFGRALRMLIIVCIIIAMVVFFGGQLLQISKSREKGGD